MSNNQFVISTLIEKREQLIVAQRKLHEEIQSQINEIEDALEVLAGKKVWRTENKELYDDLNIDYIRNSEDGI